MSNFDELCDRITAEDLEVFSMLKHWSASPQVNDHITDTSIFNALTNPHTNLGRATISILAHGGEDLS